MELSVYGVTTVNPSADAICRAVDATPHPEDWYLCLNSKDGTVIDVDIRADGMFDVSAVDRGRDLVARTPLDGGVLKEILLKVRTGDSSWATASFWDELPAATPSRRMSRPPTWTLVVVGSIAAVVVAVMLLKGSDHEWRAALPFGNSDFFWVALIALPMVVLVVVAVLVKLMEVRRAAAWPSAMGRVVRSENEEQRHTNEADQVAVTIVAVIEYEFTVAGHIWRGNRVSIGEIANTEATLQRYPVGMVVEVFYDPADPRNACWSAIRGRGATGDSSPAKLGRCPVMRGGGVMAGSAPLSGALFWNT